MIDFQNLPSQGIRTTVKKTRQTFDFPVTRQDAVEMAMAHLGFGCSDYSLSCYDVVYPLSATEQMALLYADQYTNPTPCVECEERNQNKSDPLSGPEAERRRADQIDINFKFLLNCVEEIHAALCPDHIGIWQDRAKEAVKAVKKHK